MIILTRGYGQTDRPTHRPTDIATYRAAIAAKNDNCKGRFQKKRKKSGIFH